MNVAKENSKIGQTRHNSRLLPPEQASSADYEKNISSTNTNGDLQVTVINDSTSGNKNKLEQNTENIVETTPTFGTAEQSENNEQQLAVKTPQPNIDKLPRNKKKIVRNSIILLMVICFIGATLAGIMVKRASHPAIIQSSLDYAHYIPPKHTKSAPISIETNNGDGYLGSYIDGVRLVYPTINQNEHYNDISNKFYYGWSVAKAGTPFQFVVFEPNSKSHATPTRDPVPSKESNGDSISDMPNDKNIIHLTVKCAFWGYHGLKHVTNCFTFSAVSVNLFTNDFDKAITNPPLLNAVDSSAKPPKNFNFATVYIIITDNHHVLYISLKGYRNNQDLGVIGYQQIPGQNSLDKFNC